MKAETPPPQVRIDKWLWAARFFKTRSLAKAAVEGGKVHLEGSRIKPSREVKTGQSLTIRRGEEEYTVTIIGIAERRGPAKEAALLYQETDASIEQRETRRSEARMMRAGLSVPSTRPDKKGRRELMKLKQENLPHPADE